MHFLLDKGYFMLAYSHYPKPHWSELEWGVDVVEGGSDGREEQSRWVVSSEWV